MRYFKTLNLELHQIESNLSDEQINSIIMANSLIEISETDFNILYNSKVPNSNDIRIKEIYNELESLDLQSIRPLRAKINGSATADDELKLANLEYLATELRNELRTLI